MSVFTTRHLHTCMSEHMGISPYTSKPLSVTSLSTVRSHHRVTGHPIFFEDFSILSSSSNFELLLRESLLIERMKPSLNVNIRSFPLTLF